MNGYHRNRACPCARCRCKSYTAPAILVTLGVLFLLSEYTRYDIGQTWPILLIVVGIVVVLQRNAPATGHMEITQTGPESGAATISGGGEEPPADGQRVSRG